MANEILKIICYILIPIFLFSTCKKLAAGSYPYAEFYTLDISEDTLIERIKEFKTEYPEYRVMQMQSDGSLKEEKDYYLRNYYVPYFYLAEYDLVMHCVVSKNIKDLGELGLYRVRTSNIGSGKINTSDFTKAKNKEFKEIFEKEVLSPLKEFIAKEQ